MIIERLLKWLLTPVIFIFHLHFCASQDYTWWNDLHNWDGTTHWHNYLTLSPAFMGPNALPVPDITHGKIPDGPTLKLGLERHISSGDRTNNLSATIYFPLFTPRVGLNIHVVPWEQYKMNQTTRDMRKSRDFDGQGTANGDIYFGTYIQLVENKKNFPDVLLTLNLRTASGNNLAAARFTNTPGYFFNVSVGKSITLNSTAIKSIRPYALVGFYAWQTYRDDYYQNDSFLYGLGCDLQISQLEIRNSLGGYIGYIGNGDRPMVYRFVIKSKFESKYNYELGFQQGISDFPYSSFRLGISVNFRKLK